MRILVIGSGGREHALVWKLRQSKKAQSLFCIPGNAGIHRMAECPQVKIEVRENFSTLLDWIEDQKIDLTVVGPEAPLADGLVDAFHNRFGQNREENQKRIFGPTKAAAQLEASKIFCKEFFLEFGIPTAKAQKCFGPEEVKQVAHGFGFPDQAIVLKADGLAAGKGVWICGEENQLEEALEAFFKEKRYGQASDRVLVEEFLTGEEVSFLVLSDGENALAFPSSQDHKRAFDQDQGPNTGGMGAYSPAPIFTEALEKEVMQEVIEPTLKGMKKRGTPYRGILYAGLMMTPQGPKVLEYNCRFGDPEAQVLLMRLKGDLIDLLDLTLKGQLNELAEEEIQNLWDPQSSVCVVMASGGYPLSYQKGFSIKGLAGVQGDGVVFHAGTRLHEGSIVNDGGRVLGVTALGENLKEAIDRAYKIVSQITWQGEFHRNDIGQKGLKGLLKD